MLSRNKKKRITPGLCCNLGLHCPPKGSCVQKWALRKWLEHWAFSLLMDQSLSPDWMHCYKVQADWRRSPTGGGAWRSRSSPWLLPSPSLAGHRHTNRFALLVPFHHASSTKLVDHGLNSWAKINLSFKLWVSGIVPQNEKVTRTVWIFNKRLVQWAKPREETLAIKHQNSLNSWVHRVPELVLDSREGSKMQLKLHLKACEGIS